MTVNDILTEPLLVTGTSKADAQRRVRELLDEVQLPSNAGSRYPREFSGGQRQRVAIARALCREPRLIVADEPVSALDLSTQARVLDLFADIQARTGVALLFVTHDLDVVRHISDRVAVMRAGRIVETGDTESVITDPQHPYTRALLLASPIAHPTQQAERRAERLDFLTPRRRRSPRCGDIRHSLRSPPTGDGRPACLGRVDQFLSFLARGLSEVINRNREGTLF